MITPIDVSVITCKSCTEICVFCNPKGDLDIGEDNDFHYDSSCGSVGSVSITMDVPNEFDASNPEAMTKLIRYVTCDMIPQKSCTHGCPSPRRDNHKKWGNLRLLQVKQLYLELRLP